MLKLMSKKNIYNFTLKIFVYLNLCFVLQPTLGLHSRVVMHDIPVNVVPRRLWEEYQEPVLPQFDVSIRPKKKYVCVSGNMKL